MLVLGARNDRPGRLGCNLLDPCGRCTGAGCGRFRGKPGCAGVARTGKSSIPGLRLEYWFRQRSGSRSAASGQRPSQRSVGRARAADRPPAASQWHRARGSRRLDRHRRAVGLREVPRDCEGGEDRRSSGPRPLDRISRAGPPDPPRWNSMPGRDPAIPDCPSSQGENLLFCRLRT